MALSMLTAALLAFATTTVNAQPPGGGPYVAPPPSPVTPDIVFTPGDTLHANVCERDRCTDLQKTKILFDPQSDGFSGKWCAAITQADFDQWEATACEDFYLLKRDWPDFQPPDRNPVDHMLICKTGAPGQAKCVGAWYDPTEQYNPYCPGAALGPLGVAIKG